MSSSSSSEPPLLSPSPSPSPSRSRSLRHQSLRQASQFLRGTMREPSLVVRESAADHLESRQSDWAYSKPVVALDVGWNIGFIVTAVAVLVLSVGQDPAAPLRVWIGGYGMQCLMHIVAVLLELRKRRQRRWRTQEESTSETSWLSEDEGYVTLAQFTDQGDSAAAKHLGSVNTMFSFVWWLLGFYWVSDAGPQLIEHSPLLYWSCIVFLAIDVFFVVFFMALACVIGVAICCFLPCIIAILYALEEQEGASKEEVERLTKYRFRRVDNTKQKFSDGEMQGPGGVMTECETETHSERYLASEDAECCICLSAYGDGAELRELPCGHHFHCTCVDKWLFINATCPLCKYNITQSLNSSSQEV